MTEVKRGNRADLTAAELQALDERVLPTARRWLRTHPPFADHAIHTLTHWGEPLVDDQGRPYSPERRA